MESTSHHGVCDDIASVELEREKLIAQHLQALALASGDVPGSHTAYMDTLHFANGGAYGQPNSQLVFPPSSMYFVPPPPNRPPLSAKVFGPHRPKTETTFIRRSISTDISGAPFSGSFHMTLPSPNPALMARRVPSTVEEEGQTCDGADNAADAAPAEQVGDINSAEVAVAAEKPAGDDGERAGEKDAAHTVRAPSVVTTEMGEGLMSCPESVGSAVAVAAAAAAATVGEAGGCEIVKGGHNSPNNTMLSSFADIAETHPQLQLLRNRGVDPLQLPGVFSHLSPRARLRSVNTATDSDAVAAVVGTNAAAAVSPTNSIAPPTPTAQTPTALARSAQMRARAMAAARSFARAGAAAAGVDLESVGDSMVATVGPPATLQDQEAEGEDPFEQYCAAPGAEMPVPVFVGAPEVGLGTRLEHDDGATEADSIAAASAVIDAAAAAGTARVDSISVAGFDFAEPRHSFSGFAGHFHGAQSCAHGSMSDRYTALLSGADMGTGMCLNTGADTNTCADTRGVNVDSVCIGFDNADEPLGFVAPSGAFLAEVMHLARTREEMARRRLETLPPSPLAPSFAELRMPVHGHAPPSDAPLPLLGSDADLGIAPPRRRPRAHARARARARARALARAAAGKGEDKDNEGEGKGEDKGQGKEEGEDEAGVSTGTGQGAEGDASLSNDCGPSNDGEVDGGDMGYYDEEDGNNDNSNENRGGCTRSDGDNNGPIHSTCHAGLRSGADALSAGDEAPFTAGRASPTAPTAAAAAALPPQSEIDRAIGELSQGLSYSDAQVLAQARVRDEAFAAAAVAAAATNAAAADSSTVTTGVISPGLMSHIEAQAEAIVNAQVHAQLHARMQARVHHEAGTNEASARVQAERGFGPEVSRILGRRVSFTASEVGVIAADDGAGPVASPTINAGMGTAMGMGLSVFTGPSVGDGVEGGLAPLSHSSFPFPILTSNVPDAGPADPAVQAMRNLMLQQQQAHEEQQEALREQSERQRLLLLRYQQIAYQREQARQEKQHQELLREQQLYFPPATTPASKPAADKVDLAAAEAEAAGAAVLAEAEAAEAAEAAAFEAEDAAAAAEAAKHDDNPMAKLYASGVRYITTDEYREELERLGRRERRRQREAAERGRQHALEGKEADEGNAKGGNEAREEVPAHSRDSTADVTLVISGTPFARMRRVVPGELETIAAAAAAAAAAAGARAFTSKCDDSARSGADQA